MLILPASVESDPGRVLSAVLVPCSASATERTEGKHRERREPPHSAALQGATDRVPVRPSTGLQGTGGACFPAPFPRLLASSPRLYPVGTAPTTLLTWTPTPGSEPWDVASPKAKTPPSEPMSQ